MPLESKEEYLSGDHYEGEKKQSWTWLRPDKMSDLFCLPVDAMLKGNRKYRLALRWDDRYARLCIMSGLQHFIQRQAEEDAVEHPFCEQCFDRGIIVPTEEIHHRKPLSEGGTDRAYPRGGEISTGKAPRERRGGHTCKIAK